MILRPSQILNTKIKGGPLIAMPLDDNPFADWSCRLFTAAHTHYILVTNTQSLYSCVMYGRGNTDMNAFVDRVLTNLREFTEFDGHTSIYQRFIAPACTTIEFAKALNRSVIGSMNEFIAEAKYMLTERELSPFYVGFELNETPKSAIADGKSGNYGLPKDAFKMLADAMEGS